MPRDFLQEYRKGMATLTKKVKLLEEKNKELREANQSLAQTVYAQYQEIQALKNKQKQISYESPFAEIFCTTLKEFERGI